MDIPQDKNSKTISLIGSFFIWGQLLQIFDDAKVAEQKLKDFCSLPEHDALRAIAHQYNVKAKFRQLDIKKIDASKLPMIVRGADGRWFLLAKIANGKFLLQRPDASAPELLEPQAFLEIWSAEVLIITTRGSMRNLVRKFDIRWFIPELLRFKGMVFELLAASAILQSLALISPLFFQVVMDKVLVYNAVSTLEVLVVVLVAVAVFEVLLQTLRQYLATVTATRIDARLGGKLYRHLIDLPLSYFKTRSVGVTVMRVNELNSIREFITGAVNTLVIDLSFTFIFFAVMYYYSPTLTLIVAGSIPCYIAVAFFITNPLQKKIEELYRDGAINTSFLTETLTGIETVKALALEAQMVRRWEYQTRDFVHSNYKVQRLMQLSGTLVQGIQKITMVLVLWIGARKVIGLELSIGQLIAFNMMANHVSQPIIRLTELWRGFVQARVSVDRLGDVLNTLPEINDKHQKVPNNIRGEIIMRDVTFRYAPGGEAVLQDFNLEISGGQMVAFVGRSGTGKSTITKLIQKLYVPENGCILLDGVDIAGMNPVMLRQRMSIVLQESFLLNRSVRDNISIVDPAAPFSRVVEVAKTAGAHEFILELKDGYDTILAEGGMSLSGGQRQRIAIARSLMNNPSILIFDEATSALDDHSQAIVQENLKQIRHGRSVILIAHRLSTVRDCDCIFIMENGRVIESGSHLELVSKSDGAYRRLWDLQRLEISGDSRYRSEQETK